MPASSSSREFNSAQAAAQRDWQAEMSNTAWQRGVKDMRAAGINPMLAVRQGGASVGPGAAASAGAASAGISNTGGTAAGFNQGQLNSAMITNLKQDTEKKVTEASLNRLLANTATADYQKRVEEVATQKALTLQAEHTASILGNNAKGADLEGEIDSTTYGKVMRYINRSIRAITGGSSAYRNIER